MNVTSITIGFFDLVAWSITYITITDNKNDKTSKQKYATQEVTSEDLWNAVDYLQLR
jgi:hypothetical protein